MNTIKIICGHCKKEFDKPANEATRCNKLGKPMYCSLSCSVKRQMEVQKSARTEKYAGFPTRCKNCNIVLEYEKRNNTFCSKSCAAKINNSLFKKRMPDINFDSRDSSTYVFVGKPCELCGTIVNHRRKYCSTKCAGIHKSQKIYKKIENGEIANVYQVRRYLIKNRGWRCEECGWDKINKKSGKCPIQMDHVDGDAKNNSLNNLKLLCPNCHSITPTFGNLNKGNGRPERRARYLKGIKPAQQLL